MQIHVAKDGSKDYTSLQAALDSVAATSQPVTIYIHKGIYEEQLTIRTPYITLIGDSPEDTILTWHLYAREMMSDGRKRGTFRSYSCFIDTHDVTARNITFENSSGPGTSVGQALALYVDGDRIRFDHCRFLGGQDTLFTAPLPPTEIEKDGFLGPKQFSPRENGRHYYRNCYLEGDVDFIFGGATAYFDGCTIFSKNTGKEINGYVTAASTPEGIPYGYVMNHCTFLSNCPPETVYIGRPWREFAKTVLIDCFLDSHICREGWNDWNKEFAHDTVYFAEYNSTGPGAVMKERPSWVKRLTAKQATAYNLECVLSGDDHWDALAGL